VTTKCRGCGAPNPATATHCRVCNLALADGPGQSELPRAPNIGRRIFVSGLAIAAFFPAVSAFGLAAHELMGCHGGGSSGPVGGCRMFGVEFNGFAAVATPAFVASFFTVPIGVLVCIVGLVAMLVRKIFPGKRSK